MANPDLLRVALLGALTLASIGGGLEVGCAGTPTPTPLEQPAPVTAPTRPTEAPSVTPDAAAAETPAPAWRGDTCASDAECGWDDPCHAQRCGTPTVASSSAICTRSAPPPGDCACVEDRCTLRPSQLAAGRSTEGTCEADTDCAVDVGTGTCHVGGETHIGPIQQSGPVCVCQASACELTWVEPIPCETFAECSWEREPRLRPTRAKTPRTQPVEPCVDGEIDAVCEGEEGAKTCRIRAWKC
jgi:hypothetical protein